MPNLVPPRDPYKEFLAGPRIKGATAFWGVDDVADKTHPLGLPHMLPTAERFAEACCKRNRMERQQASNTNCYKCYC